MNTTIPVGSPLPNFQRRLPSISPHPAQQQFSSSEEEESSACISIDLDDEDDVDAFDHSTAGHGVLFDDDDKSHRSRHNDVPNGLDDDFEDKAVACFRFFVLFMLICAMVSAGVATWYYVGRDEEDDFEHQLTATAEAIVENSEQRVRQILAECHALVSTITALAMNARSNWPYFTDERNFHIIVQNFQHTTGAKAVAIAPRVPQGQEEKIKWENYTTTHQDWLVGGKEGTQLEEGEEAIVEDIFERQQQKTESTFSSSMYRWGEDDDSNSKFEVEDGPGPYVPMWEMEPIPTDDPSVINVNLLSHPTFERLYTSIEETKKPILSVEFDTTELFGSKASSASPKHVLVYPVTNNFNNDETTEIVGYLLIDFAWESFLNITLHDSIPPVTVVVVDECNNTATTYEMHGSNVTFEGRGDKYNPAYKGDLRNDRFMPFPTIDRDDADEKDCGYHLHVYPTHKFYATYNTEEPKFVTIVVVIIFFCTSVVFCLYDCAVHVRQRRILAIAAQSERILSILYPKTIRDRLFGTSSGGAGGGKNRSEESHRKKKSQLDKQNKAAKYQIKTFMNEDTSTDKTDFSGDAIDSKPIADLFPNTTVMFADIAGFTAWSSVREPSQVFTLLETVYRAFDIIAKRRRVFKVETVGDCYVAVTGLPDPRRDHALAMARFARECVVRFNALVGQLETSLGPDTAELGIRVGLHSGPVTAGVLRGDKSRFQLFGDTVNTAARIETTGKRNKIHLSLETAEHLQNFGRGHWLQKRDQCVEAKGKGKLQTYWLLMKDDAANQSSSHNDSQGESERYWSPDRSEIHQAAAAAAAAATTSSATTSLPEEITQAAPSLKAETAEDIEAMLPPKIQRLVKWNVDVLTRLLKQIVARRRAIGSRRNYDMMLTRAEAELRKKFMVLDEVVEIIPLPGFDQRIYKKQDDPNSIILPEPVVEQMRLYVSSIAMLYRDNAFHNFEHASHVTMSVSKLLSRIVAADDLLNADEDATKNKDFGWNVHDHTYGITSDPMTQFSVVLAALIHDVDHYGVSNFQLIKEEDKLANLFKNKSIAEQNSIVLAWDTLMDPKFHDLRRTIYADPLELQRFRQLIANTVLATDIFDKQLQALRKKRWESAFNHEVVEDVSTKDDVNRKATIVMEHLIQASDVAHTMQHWHIYRKWNERLFLEMMVAFHCGRMEKDPIGFWYKGELAFFDNYVIPLAKKLKDCGVFGVSSDEYLNYAMENRREWCQNGEEVVRELIRKFNAQEESETFNHHSHSALNEVQSQKQATQQQQQEQQQQLHDQLYRHHHRHPHLDVLPEEDKASELSDLSPAPAIPEQEQRQVAPESALA